MGICFVGSGGGPRCRGSDAAASRDQGGRLARDHRGRGEHLEVSPGPTLAVPLESISPLHCLYLKGLGELYRYCFFKKLHPVLLWQET